MGFRFSLFTYWVFFWLESQMEDKMEIRIFLTLHLSTRYALDSKGCIKPMTYLH